MSAFDEVIDQLGWATTMKRSDLQGIIWSAESAFRDDLLGAGRPGFFQPRTTYVHDRGEGRFHVEFVGVAPAGYGHHSETQGVAFGWRISADGSARGAYVTPDFAGWTEVPEHDGTGPGSVEQEHLLPADPPVIEYGVYVPNEGGAPGGTVMFTAEQRQAVADDLRLHRAVWPCHGQQLAQRTVTLGPWAAVDGGAE